MRSVACLFWVDLHALALRQLLSQAGAASVAQLTLLLVFVAQVIECRRILKWTYAYGYYNFEDEDLPQVRTGRQQSLACLLGLLGLGFRALHLQTTVAGFLMASLGSGFRAQA